MASGQYDPAIKDAISVYESTADSSLKFRAALLVANGAAITLDFSLGLRYLESGLLSKNQVSDAETRQLGFLVAAILYNQYDQYALAPHYAERLLAQSTSPRTRCAARQLRIEALAGLNVAPQDEAEYQSAIEECVNQREPIASNRIRGHLARHWADAGKVEQAIKLLESHLSKLKPPSTLG
jgi:hypothetical protein